MSTNILLPVAPFLDQTTGRPSLPWLLWLQNPSVISVTTGTALGITSGGTGLSTLPTNGQLLIGNNGAYSQNTLSNGTGIGITNGTGTISIANTGVLSTIAGTGIGVSSATGNVTISNSGVLSTIAGTGINVSNATGNVTISNAGVTSFQTSLSGLTPSTATTGTTTLAGTLGVPSGGTGAITLTGYVKGSGTSALTASSTIPYTDISGGLSVTITTAKLTLTGANGSMTFVNGILTAQTQAT